MSQKLKVITLSLGKGLGHVVVLATMMVMARVLVKEDLAAYQQTFLAYATIAPLLSMGMSQGMFYFLPAEKTRVRGRLLDGITVLAVAGLVFAVFLACGGNRLLADRFSNPKVANLLIWMIPFAIITTPTQITESVLVARGKTTLAAVFGFGRHLIIGIATIVPLLIWESVEAPFLGNVTASMLMAIMAFALMLKSVPDDSLTPSWTGIKELIAFTLPLAVGAMIATISVQLDKLIVSVMCSPEDFAVYSVGAMELPIISLVTGSIAAVFLAEMRRAVSEGNTNEALRLFHRTAQKSALVIFPAMVFFLLVADPFMALLFTPEYDRAAIPFRCYLLLLPIRTVLFTALLVALGLNQFIFFRSTVGLIVNATLSVVLVSMIGPWGAVVATVLTIYAWTVPANFYVLSKSLSIKWQDVLPFGDLARVAVDILPLAIIGGALMLLIQNSLQAATAVAFAFTVYLSVYWNNKIYSIHNLNQGFDRWRTKALLRDSSD